jgi:multiple sugar transport system substrate-binding protein
VEEDKHGPEQKHTEARNYTRRRFITTGASASAALYLAACGGSSSSSTASKAASGAGGKVTLNNLFMQQAGYSPADLAGMTAAFEKANPNIKVNNTLVAYEALHDKIVAAAPAGTYDVVLGDVIWPAEFGSKNIVRDISDKVNSLPINQVFPGALVMAKYQNKFYGMPWILDTKYMFANGSRRAVG